MAWALWGRHRVVGCRGVFPGVGSRTNTTYASCGDLRAGTCPGPGGRACLSAGPQAGQGLAGCVVALPLGGWAVPCERPSVLEAWLQAPLPFHLAAGGCFMGLPSAPPCGGRFSDLPHEKQFAKTSFTLGRFPGG